MFSPQTIRQMSDVAAWRAAEAGKQPLFIWSEEDIRHLPFLGDYIPAGWRPATFAELPGDRPRTTTYRREDEEIRFMVDSSSYGQEDEPALTFREFAQVARASRFGWGIVEAGQFQVLVEAFIQDPESPGRPAPDAESLKCEHCHTVHSPLDDCVDA